MSTMMAVSQVLTDRFIDRPTWPIQSYADSSLQSLVLWCGRRGVVPAWAGTKGTRDPPSPPPGLVKRSLVGARPSRTALAMPPSPPHRFRLQLSMHVAHRVHRPLRSPGPLVISEGFGSGGCANAVDTCIGWVSDWQGVGAAVQAAALLRLSKRRKRQAEVDLEEMRQCDDVRILVPKMYKLISISQSSAVGVLHR